MKLLIYSDLHLEHYAFEPQPEAVAEADVVILAGDIHVEGQGVPWAARVFADKPVLYVPGNHEFYDEYRLRHLADLKVAAAATDNVRVLDRDGVEIGGTWFLGTTLWTDYELFIDPDASWTSREIDRVAAMNEARRKLSDYKLIRERSGKDGHTKPYDLYEEHQQSRKWLQAKLTELQALHPQAPRIVITHHAPAAESLGRWLPDSRSPAYASNLPAEILGAADSWVHGHIHDPVDYMRHGCRVMSNPRGYPDRKSLILRVDTDFDNPDFSDMLIDVDPSVPAETWKKTVVRPDRLRAMSLGARPAEHDPEP